MKKIDFYIDFDEIEKETGKRFDVNGEYDDSFIIKIKSLSYWLATHNKNYTKEQEYKAQELYDLLKNVHSSWDMKS